MCTAPSWSVLGERCGHIPATGNIFSLTKHRGGGGLHSCQSGVRGEGSGRRRGLVVREGFVEEVEMCVSLCVYNLDTERPRGSTAGKGRGARVLLSNFVSPRERCAGFVLAVLRWGGRQPSLGRRACAGLAGLPVAEPRRTPGRHFASSDRLCFSPGQSLSSLALIVLF